MKHTVRYSHPGVDFGNVQTTTIDNNVNLADALAFFGRNGFAVVSITDESDVAPLIPESAGAESNF